MGKRKKYSGRKENHLQYKTATKSINDSSNKASESATGESKAPKEEEDFSQENSTLESAPDECSISGYKTLVKAAEKSYDVISNLKNEVTNISNKGYGTALSNRDGLENSLFKPLTLEGELLEKSGDKRDTNEQNTLDKSFPTSVKADDEAAEKTSEVGKQITGSELKHENSSIFSELMNQFQRHAVKKVSNEHDKPAESKLSRIGQISSYTSTTLINETPDLNTEVHSMQIPSTNSLSTESCNNLDLPNTKNDYELSRDMKFESAHNQETPINQSPSNVAVNNLNVLNGDECEGKFDRNHQNLMNQPSPNESENNLNADSNDPEEIQENELESTQRNSMNQTSPNESNNNLNGMPNKFIPHPQNYVKYKSCGVQTNEVSESYDSGTVSIREKKSDDNSKQRKFKKIFSDDKKEFIKREKKSNGFEYSGKICLDLIGSYYHFTFGHFGRENIIVIDSLNYDKFVGCVKIVNGEELKFNEPFEYNKTIVLERILITKILADDLLDKRNATYDDLLRTLESRSKNISDDPSCTEDFLQFLLIGKLQNLSLDKPIFLLKTMIQNEFISNEVKKEAELLLQVENLLYSRNQFFPKFSHTSNSNTRDLFAAVRSTCQEGVKNHKRNLLNKCPNKSFHLVCLIVTINRLPGRNLLYISNRDIELFSNIMELTDEKDHSGNEIFPINFVEYYWNNYFKKIQTEKAKSLKQLGPMTHPLYLFLLKTLREVIADICSRTQLTTSELLSTRNGELVMKDSIPWSSKNPVDKSLEEQYRLIFRLMKHFEPGMYSCQNNFTYKFKLLNENENKSLWKSVKKLIFGNLYDFKNIPQDRIVWLYIVDCAVAPLLGDKSTSRFKQISLSVVTGFVKFIQTTKHDQYETFRVATHNIIKFTAQISPYFSDINSILTDVDHTILNKQIDIISGLLCPKDNEVASGNFSDLMTIYNEYWENRETIVGKLPIPCSIFKPDVEVVMTKLIQIVRKALLKDFRPLLTIKFLRLYNEFLKHLRGIDFTWFVSKNIYFPELEGVVEKVSKNDVVSYKITEPDEFIERLKKKRKTHPKHFSIEVVNKLLDVVSMSFDKNNWDDEDCVSAAGDLFLAVGHSCSHFEDQTDYTDLEHFLRDCTVPFCCVIEKSRTYSEFKQRLENVENFYLYSRKLNQIGIEQALELCTEGVKEAGNNGFQTKIEKSVLEDCYNLYSKKFASLENLQVSDILDDIENTVEQLPLDKWSMDFKRNILPILLADLAAVWSLQESTDVAVIKKRIEPHCVQILCLFRLLGVDQDASGVPKHFAQVLTGQGKSLILALLSSVIALTGNKAFVVCYSDYLAKRDETSFDLFFKAFNRFDLKNKISYNTFRDMANEILTRKVGGVKKDLRSIVSDLILNKLTKQVIDAIEIPKNTVLLIDEADVFFSDKYGETYEPATRVGIPELLKIQPKIWSIIENGVSEKNMILRKIKEYINDIIKDEECDDFRNFLKTTSDFFEKNLIEMVEDAIVVSKTKEDDTYKIDEITGFLNVKSRSFVYTSRTINGYQNTFHYFKLKKENYKDSFFSNFGYLLISLGSISYASLPVRYENILGVSGTLMTLNNSERNAIKNYGIQTMSAMPSFFGESKLVFKPTENALIFDTEESWLENIFESVSKSIHADRARAALIFFETDGKIKLFEQKYRNRINRLYTLTGNEKPDILEWRINESGVAQTVTLTTRTMGRGVDYKSNDRNVEDNGGVHVIQTFFSLDEKEETQIKGRTARKDNKGSYELILCREDLEAIQCSENESGRSINTYAELCKIRRKIANNKGSEVESNIRRSEQVHNMTIEFFESLAEYSTEKRHHYFSKFPFVID